MLQVSDFCSIDSNMVHFPDFENAVVKIIDEVENMLTDAEKETVKCFLLHDDRIGESIANEETKTVDAAMV